MKDLDLAKPGALWATVEHQKATTFHLVVPQARYTKENLSKSPVLSPQDQLMTPFTIPFTGTSKDGLATLDLAASGRAKEIMARLTERYDRGEPRVETVRAVVVATAQEGNKIPDAQLAEVMDFKLLPIPAIRLKGLTTYLTVQNHKAGRSEFSAELSVMGPITEIVLTTMPGSSIKASTGQSGSGTLKIPVKEGQKYTITVPAPFRKRTETKQELAERAYMHYGVNETASWGSGYHQSWMRRLGGSRYGLATFTREIWDGGFIALRAAATGDFACLSQGVNFTAEAWAPAWLLTQPPAPFYHNCC